MKQRCRPAEIVNIGRKSGADKDLDQDFMAGRFGPAFCFTSANVNRQMLRKNLKEKP
ncbi:MAG: hypothetical protein ABSD08_20430 [Xanthobacteraceae bacterium]